MLLAHKQSNTWYSMCLFCNMSVKATQFLVSGRSLGCTIWFQDLFLGSSCGIVDAGRMRRCIFEPPRKSSENHWMGTFQENNRHGKLMDSQEKWSAAGCFPYLKVPETYWRVSHMARWGSNFYVSSVGVYVSWQDGIIIQSSQWLSCWHNHRCLGIMEIGDLENLKRCPSSELP